MTPLTDLLALIEREVQPLAPRVVPLREALHAVLAADVVPRAHPAQALALIDGWALAAETTLDAGTYAGAPLPALPSRVEVGQPLPPGTDSVAPIDTVKVIGDRAEALLPVDPGNGVLPAAADCDASTPLYRAGHSLRNVDLAVLAAAGIVEVTVRMPRLCVAAVRRDTIIDAAARLIAADAAGNGGQTRKADGDLLPALAARDADFIVAIGGTGGGRNDASVRALAQVGRIEVHGIGLTPGESAAFGFVNSRPVLLVPGRLDSALAAWLTIGRRILVRLSGGRPEIAAATASLSRKIVSTIGLAEVVPVRRTGHTAEPLAIKYLPWSTLARADGFILVPAESEGYSVGSEVSLWPWP
ncbi:MAG: molybdopterin-binding protein [Pseudolabrys sp.]|nr:molybdopterin-binding protein [Pseudolabrys sp.]